MWSDNEASIDLLRFRSLAKTINEVITTDTLLPTTIGVFGDWGSGKSTLLKMIENDLNGADDVMCLTFNGWLFEGYEDAKTALMGSIIDALEDRAKANESFLKKSKDLIAKLLGRVSWMQAIGLVSKYGLPILLGMPQLAAVAATSDMMREEPTSPEEFTKLFKMSPKELQEIRRNIRDFRNDFANLLQATEVSILVVFIDDLDRCLPESVIATLEAIRLFLFVPNTVFILGADERLVEYAARTRFPATPGVERELAIGRDYLEKLIQIPIRIPPLSSGEIESYMNLLFAEKCLTAECYSSLCENLAKVKTADVFARSFDIESARHLLVDTEVSLIQADLDLTARIVPILSQGLGGNPRRTKRFLNTMILRMRLSKERGIDLEQRVLVKLMVLEYTKPEFFKQIASLQILQEGKPSELKEAEKYVVGATSDGKEEKPDLAQDADTITEKKQQTAKDSKFRPDSEPQDVSESGLSWQVQTWVTDEWMLRWLKLAPTLSDVDLRPYFYIAHDKVGAFTGSQLRLTPRAREVLNRLISPQDMSRKLGLNELATLSEPDINSIFQSFTDQIRQMESSASSQLEKTLFEVVEKKKDLLPQLIAFYEALSDLRIVPAILPMLLRVSKGTPAEGLARNLISRWSKSSNNVLATASKQILNRKN